MPKCDRCGAFMESAATACTWCGAGGDNGSAASFVVPKAPVAPAAALAGAESGTVPSLAADPLAAEQENLKGIAGWLALVAVTLAVAPLSLLLAVAADLVLLIGNRIPASASHSTVTGLLYFDVLTDLILLAALIVLNIFFYGKKKLFPRWFILFLATSFFLTFALQQMISSYLPSYPSLVAFGSFVSASGWIPYFLRSERAKQTFVN